MSLLNPIDFPEAFGFTSAAVDASDSPTATRQGKTTVVSFKCGIRRCSLSDTFVPAIAHTNISKSRGKSLGIYFL
jgi:hypothetical protein